MKRRELLAAGAVGFLAGIAGSLMPLLRNDAIRQHPSIRTRPENQRAWEDFLSALDAQDVFVNARTWWPTAAWEGFSTAPVDTGNLFYSQLGSWVMVFTDANVQGTSNDTIFRLNGLPENIAPSSGSVCPNVILRDNNSAVLGSATVNTNQIVFQIYDGSGAFPFSASGFTASNNKGMDSGMVLIYPL